jgi:WD40 repeat protein
MRIPPTIIATLALAGPALAQEPDPPVVEPTWTLEHPETIRHLAVDPDGEVVFLGDAEGHVLAWDAEDREVLWESRGLDRPFAALAAGEDLLVLSTTGKLGYHALDTEDGEPLPDGNDSDPEAWVLIQPGAMALDPRGRWVWMQIPGGLMRRDVGTALGWSRRPIDNGGTRSLRMDRKAEVMAVGGVDGTIRFVGPASANVDSKKVFEAHEGPVTALAFDRRGSKLLSGGADGIVRLWKMHNGKVDLELAAESAITAVTCDDKGRWIAVGEASGAVHVWSMKGKGELLATLAEPGDMPCVGLAFVDKDRALVAACGRQLAAWDLKTADL